MAAVVAAAAAAAVGSELRIPAILPLMMRSRGFYPSGGPKSPVFGQSRFWKTSVEEIQQKQTKKQTKKRASKSESSV